MSNPEAVKRAQRRKKQTIVELFGGKCCMCGYDKCINALEFHHLDETTKEARPSYIIMRWSFDKLKKELDKCILVCANCHREIHAEKFLGLDTDLKNYVKPWLTKNCGFCKKEFVTKKEGGIFCSQSCSSRSIKRTKKPKIEKIKKSRRKVERPTREDLSELMKSTSWTQMGRMFGVSDNGVRKWAKEYQLLS